MVFITFITAKEAVMTRMLKTIFSVFLFFLLLILPAIQVYAEQNPRELLNQYVSDLRNNPGDTALREKIIKLAHELKPAPAIPEEAEKYMVRGAVAIKHAKNVEDYREAAFEFSKAALAAPWLAEVYNNIGVAYEKAGDYPDAISNFRLYLVASPEAPDAKQVKAYIYELEFKEEKAQKLKSAEELLGLLKGVWRKHWCRAAPPSKPGWGDGCNLEEANGTNWGAMSSGQFTFPGDGTVILFHRNGMARCDVGPVVGIVEGSALSDVRWEYRPEDGPAREIYSDISNDGTYLKISCNRPLSNFDPNKRYHYIFWSRP